MTAPEHLHPASGTRIRGSVAHPLSRRFASSLARDGVLKPGGPVVVALSGGVDSVVLLHLLRFNPGVPMLELVAAHFDHRMRAGSGADALWVGGLCRAWDVPCHQGRAEAVFTSEEPAREARYEFLHRVVENVGAARLLTAHHADDQAETVLFRVLRGTGLRGLAGIPRERWPRVYRPLLSFTRVQIEAYARAVGIRHREDPTNLDPSFPRNLLRHRVLPAVEKGVAPGARRALRRLARLARENEEGWDSIIPTLLEGVVEERERELSVVRSAFLAYHPAVQSRLLREVFRRAGIRPGEAGTRAALEFTRTGASGGASDLPGGYRLSRDFDRLILAPGPDTTRDRLLTILDASGGGGEAVIGGRRLTFRWGPDLEAGVRGVFRAPAVALDFPLCLRGWAPGDRIRLPYGRKKLKKLFGEAKIPAAERSRIPVLVDGRGRVLWVEEPATMATGAEAPGGADFLLGIVHAHEP